MKLERYKNTSEGNNKWRTSGRNYNVGNNVTLNNQSFANIQDKDIFANRCRVCL